MTEFYKEEPKLIISFGIKSRNVPIEIETSAPLRYLPELINVMIYIRVTNKWQCPVTDVTIDGETFIIQTGQDRTIFRSSRAKP